MSPHNPQIFAQIQAEVARVEGMKAANEVSKLREEYPKYDQGDFDSSADQMENLMREVSHESFKR